MEEQKMEEDLELKGYAVMQKDGKTYLHISFKNMLATDMKELINKYNAYKIIFH